MGETTGECWRVSSAAFLLLAGIFAAKLKKLKKSEAVAGAVAVAYVMRSPTHGQDVCGHLLYVVSQGIQYCCNHGGLVFQH